MKKFGYSLLLLFVIVSCSEVFDAPPKALMQVTLVNTDTLDTSIPKVSVYGVDQDSIWIYQQQTSTFLLQLSPDSSSSFVLLLDSLVDTLTIFHETQLIFESAETGFYLEYKIKDIEHTSHRIDDYEVTDSLVTKNWHENIQLYFNPLSAGNN